MRYGYSNLLGETVPAELLEYHDCEQFQVVCPNCREPVFKAVRRTPAEVHFLSHYEASQALQQECELRVAAFRRNSRETVEGERRNWRAMSRTPSCCA